MFFSLVNVTHANVVINEVQIGPTEGRFIELYNNGTESVDLTDWYIQRKTATGTSFGSLVSKTNFVGKSIAPDGYFLISKISFGNSDIVYDSLTLTESNSIQLKNSAGEIIDKLGYGGSNDCNTLCAPAPIDGKSVSRDTNGSFVIATSTPGTLNLSLENIDIGGSTTTLNNNDTTTSPSSSTSSSSSSGSSLIKTVPEVYKIVTKIVAPKIVYASVPFILDQLTTGTKKEKITLGKFSWNFGDGMLKESTTSPIFEYAYDYAGDYVLTLSYYTTALEDHPIATDRVAIKVIPSGIIISGAGTVTDPYIEIENKSNFEMSLYKWVVKGSTHSFTIPKGTVILPNKKLKLSPHITGFDFSDMNSISIVDTSGQIFASYPNIIEPKIMDTIIKVEAKKTISPLIVIDDRVKEIKTEPEVINLNDLGASVVGSSGAIGNISNGLNNITLIYLGLIGIIIIGALSIILLRQRKEIPDYLEKGISAKDMTIIE